MERIDRVTVGSIELISLLDANLELPGEVFLNVPPDKESEISSMPEKKLTASHVNAYIVKTGNSTLLVDAGCRDVFGPTGGFLIEALQNANIEPKEITDIFFTHLHPDHVAGAVDAEGTAVFPNAELKVVSDEYKFWHSDNFQDVDVNGKNFANMAKATIDAYGDRISMVSDNDTIVPGVTVLSLPGHTPAHAGFRIDEGGETFVHMGDALHAQALQLSDPKISIAFDVDPEQARKSREMVFDMVATDKLLCTGSHVITPKFGFLKREGTGYTLEMGA